MSTGKAKRKYQEQQTKIKERFKSTYVWALEQSTEHLQNILRGEVTQMHDYFPLQLSDDVIKWSGITGVSQTDKEAIDVLIKQRAKL